MSLDLLRSHPYHIWDCCTELIFISPLIPTPNPCCPYTHPLLSLHPTPAVPTPTPCCPYTHPLLSLHPPPAVPTPNPCCPYTHPLLSLHPTPAVPTPNPCCPYTHPLLSLHPIPAVPTPNPCCPYTQPLLSLHPTPAVLTLGSNILYHGVLLMFNIWTAFKVHCCVYMEHVVYIQVYMLVLTVAYMAISCLISICCCTTTCWRYFTARDWYFLCSCFLTYWRGSCLACHLLGLAISLQYFC